MLCFCRHFLSPAFISSFFHLFGSLLSHVNINLLWMPVTLRQCDKLTEAEIAVLVSLRRLRSLDISRRISESVVHNISDSLDRLPELQSLKVDIIHHPLNMSRLVQQLPHLRKISLSQEDDPGSAYLMPLAQLPQLTSVSIKMNTQGPRQCCCGTR
jgi:hypothetical protein